MSAPTIAKDAVVSIHYTLRDGAADGEVLDSSDGGPPMAYLHGHSNIIPGLERALEGQAPGHTATVIVGPEEGYGIRDEALLKTFPRAMFPPEAPLAAGMRFVAGTPDNQEVLFTVQSVDDANVQADGNHPLAGTTLHFEVEVAEIRAASPEELSHGHVHGPGGHHH